MNTISYKAGYWSALLILICFFSWIVCFTGIAFSSPLFYWTNLQDYLLFERTYPQYFQLAAKAFMLLFGPVYVVLINSLYDLALPSRKTVARIALLFSLAFAICSCLHYFIQLSSVRINVEHGQIGGIEQFLQANPYSFMTAADMLGWTLFLGLSSLFAFAAIKKERTNKWLKISMLVNGISSLLGGIGYLFQLPLLTFIFINLGVGGAMIGVGFFSLKFFRRGETMRETLI